MAPKILKFFLVVFDIYTQPWTKLQNEIQKFCFFRTGYSASPPPSPSAPSIEVLEHKDVYNP